MSDEFIDPDAVDPGISHEDAPPGRSVIDQVLENHQRRAGYLKLPIPEWDGDVVVRYGRMSKKAIKAITRGTKTLEASSADLLENACLEIFVRDEEGDLQPARKGDGLEQPVRFDGRLSDMFGLRGKTPREIVVKMYADDVAIIAHAKRIYDWQTGETLEDLEPEEVDEEVGEEAAAT